MPATAVDHQTFCFAPSAKPVTVQTGFRYPKPPELLFVVGQPMAIMHVRRGVDVHDLIAAVRDGFAGDALSPIHPLKGDMPAPLDFPPPEASFPQVVRLIIRRLKNRWQLPIGEHLADIHLADGVSLNKVIDLAHDRVIWPTTA